MINRTDIKIWWIENQRIVRFFVAATIGLSLSWIITSRMIFSGPVVSESIVRAEVIGRYSVPGRLSRATQVVYVSLPDGGTTTVEVPMGFDGRDGNPINLRRLVQDNGRVTYQYRGD